jgi:hypothetical protein
LLLPCYDEDEEVEEEVVGANDEAAAEEGDDDEEEGDDEEEEGDDEGEEGDAVHVPARPPPLGLVLPRWTRRASTVESKTNRGEILRDWNEVVLPLAAKAEAAAVDAANLRDSAIDAKDDVYARADASGAILPDRPPASIVAVAGFDPAAVAIAASESESKGIELALRCSRGGFVPYALDFVPDSAVGKSFRATAQWVFQQYESESLHASPTDLGHETRSQVRLVPSVMDAMEPLRRARLEAFVANLQPAVHHFTHKPAGTWKANAPYFIMTSAACGPSPWSLDSWTDYPVVCVRIWGQPALPEFLDTPWFEVDTLPSPEGDDPDQDPCAKAFQALPRVSRTWREGPLAVRPLPTNAATGDTTIFWSTCIHRFPAMARPKPRAEFETLMLLYVPFVPADWSAEECDAAAADVVLNEQWQDVMLGRH